MFVSVREDSLPTVGNIVFATYPPHIAEPNSIQMSPIISELLFALGIYIGTVEDGFTLFERISRDPFIHNMYSVTISVMDLPIRLGENNIPDYTRWYDMFAAIFNNDDLNVGNARLETRGGALWHIRASNLIVDLPYQYLRLLSLVVPRFAMRNQMKAIASETPFDGFERVFAEICRLQLQISVNPPMLAMV